MITARPAALLDLERASRVAVRDDQAREAEKLWEQAQTDILPQINELLPAVEQQEPELAASMRVAIQARNAMDCLQGLIYFWIVVGDTTGQMRGRP